MALEIKSAKEAFLEARAQDQHAEYFVLWDDITERHIENLERCLESATLESELQAFLEANPLLLIQHLGGGHGRWVIPQKRLGSEYVTDFLIGHKDSMGYYWQAVELESPRERLFTKSGDPANRLNHAIRQITDWRTWLSRNQNYASRPKSESGLGLTDVTHNLKGLIIIGRDTDCNPETNMRRRQLGEQSNIEIHPYDWLIRNARGRVAALSKLRS